MCEDRPLPRIVARVEVDVSLESQAGARIGASTNSQARILRRKLRAKWRCVPSSEERDREHPLGLGAGLRCKVDAEREDLEVHLPGPPGGTPRAPPPSGLGLGLPITYINSLVQPGPICRPPPHLGSPRQPAHARWWLGGVAVRGGPRSLSPHLTPPPPHAHNLMFLTHTPILHHHHHPSQKIRPCSSLAAVGLHFPLPQPPWGWSRVPAPLNPLPL